MDLRKSKSFINYHLTPLFTWAVHEVTLSALHGSSQSCTFKTTVGRRRIGTSSTPNHDSGSTGMRAARPLTPLSVVTVNYEKYQHNLKNTYYNTVGKSWRMVGICIYSFSHAHRLPLSRTRKGNKNVVFENAGVR